MSNKLFDPQGEREARTEEDSRKLQVRTGVLVGIFGALLLAFVVVLYQTQIVHGQDYRNRANYSVRELETVDSVRGEILDRYGRVLVGNSVSYHVTLDTTLMGEERNAILTQLLELCRELGVEWKDSLPVSQDQPWSYTKEDSLFSYSVEDEEGNVTVRATNLGRLAENRKWVERAQTADLTAEELLRAMASSFGLELGEEISQQQRQLLGVLYEIYLRTTGVVSTGYVFAENVGIDLIAGVKERSLTGVKIGTGTSRAYYTSSAAHVLGYTGSITEAMWPTYQELGYAMDDIVGREGVERAFEEYLHGESGRRAIETDTNGKIVTQEWLEEPEPGDHVVLTLDSSLQAVTERYLADFIENLENPAGGAAVVVDMTGGVLAMASYPTYDPGNFNYSELASDRSSPLVNRTTMGLYAPGSTFKMVTAVAGLSSGVITPATQIQCTGIHNYYGTNQVCWIYTSTRGSHGLETVRKAITDSCNIFFYDTGANLGIATLQDYAKQFGLGEYTGIEIPEYQGQMAGPEVAQAAGVTWYGGEVLSAAIGQSLSLFTPLQLANYVATLVNGGNHYQAHLLKEVKSSDYSQTVYQYQPQLLNSIDIQPDDLSAVLGGMYDLAQTPTMARYFSSLPVSVGCKTGTAEVGGGGEATATFVCFAPFEDPEIAICLVAEKGSSGGNLAEVAAGILSQYFSTQGAQTAPVPENTLVR